MQIPQGQRHQPVPLRHRAISARASISRYSASAPRKRASTATWSPLHLNWSQPGREYDLSDRRQRARVYEIVLREGTGQDISNYVDGALLVDLWPDLILPAPLRHAWQPLIDTVREKPAK